MDSPYEGEIAFVDSQVARLIGFLERHDLLRNTLVVILGDHGESLGEHGELTHGLFVYESVLEIPFVVRAPIDGLGPRSVGAVVRTADLMPTVLELLNISLTDEVDGRSLVSLMRGATTDLGLESYSESMSPRYHFGWSELRTTTSGRYKYIDAPRPELFDLLEDPRETTNVYEVRRNLGDRMAASPHAVAAPTTDAARPAVEVDPDTRARLAALGYVEAATWRQSEQHPGAAADGADSPRSWPT